MKLLSHHCLVDSDLVGQIGCHGVPLFLHHGERATVEPSPGDKVWGCRVWDDDSGGVPQREGVVSDPPVVEGSGFGRLGEHSNLHPMYIRKIGQDTGISEPYMSMDKWATSKSTQLSTKVWVKLLLLYENALILNFEALYLTENLDPLQGPTRPHFAPSSTHTEQVK